MAVHRPRARLVARLTFLACVAVVLAACSASLTIPQSGIEGPWRWVKSEGGLMPADRTPATEGYSLTLIFEADGVARLLQDGLASGETTYEVTTGGVGAHEGVPVVRFGEPILGFAEQSYQFVTRDSLLLHDGCCDGFTWHFARIVDP